MIAMALALTPLLPVATAGPGSRPVARAEDWVEIRVVDESGAPVPHAAVDRIAPARGGSVDWYDDDDGFWLARVLASDHPEQISERSPCAPTDERGRTRAPLDPAGWLVASTGTRFGYTTFHEQVAEPVRIVVVPDEPLLVRVVDTRDEPLAGVPVTLSATDDSWRWRYCAIPGVITARTGADGVAVFPHRRTLLADALGDAWDYSSGADVHLATPSPSSGWLFAHPAASTTAPPTLRTATETGRIEVRFVWADGVPCTSPLQLFVELPGREHGPRSPVPLFAPREAGAHFWVTDGVLELPGAEVGADAWLDGWYDGGSGYLNDQLVRGPRAAGECATTVVRLPEESRVAVRGSATGPEGQPLTVWRWWFDQDGEGDWPGLHGTFIDTDAGGGFGLRVALERPGDAPRGLLHLRAEDGVGRPFEARLEVALPRPGEVLELGSVAFERSPLALAGRVVAAGGRPVEGALVRLTETARGPLFVWSRSEGRFWVAGAPLEGARLRAERAAVRLSGGAFVGHDQREVTVAVAPHPVITGRLLLPPGVPPELLVVSDEGPERGLDLTNDFAGVARDGSFRIPWRPAPNATFAVGALEAAGGELVAGVPFAVGAGPVQRPAALAHLDLRDVLHGVRLEVVDPDGQLAPFVHVRHRAPGARAWTELDSHGLVRLVTRHPALDLELRAPGHAPVHLERVAGTRRVRLDPPLEVELALADDPRLPPDVALGVWLGSEELSTGSRGATWFEGGTARAAVPAPGRYLLVWSVYGLSADGLRFELEVGLEGAGEEGVDVTGLGSPVVLPLPAAERLRDALDELDWLRRHPEDR